VKNKIKNILILGSTGSVGTQTLEVVKKHRDKFKVFGLVCFRNEKLLKKQAREFGVKKTALASKNPQKITEFINDKKVDIVVNAISGEAGLRPSLATLKAGKILALANKESVVLGIKKFNQNILPLDSEHHAIARILKEKKLQKFTKDRISKITITCSGGPFFGYKKNMLRKVRAKDALSHPTWKMGPKITIESATLLNKAYELIEAHHLFNCPLNKLEAVIDRRSFVHAIVDFKNPKERIALAYKPDMKIVIEDTLLGYKKNREIKFLKGKALSLYRFEKVNHKVFPAIKKTLAAYKAGEIKNFFRKKEKAIASFLKGEIKFDKIV